MAKCFLASPKFKYKRNQLLAVKPVFINFALTYRCNSRCLTCQNWRRYQEDPDKLKEELKLKDLEKFIAENENWLNELRHIGIAGGEPFLREDLVDVIRLFRARLPHVSLGLQTNGLLPEVIKKKLVEIKSFYPEITLAVSLDGLKRNHDLMRGVGGAYEKALKTIKIAQDLEVKGLSAGMTVTDKNYQDIKPLLEMTQEMGIDFSFYPADGGDYYHTNVWPKKSQKTSQALISALADSPGDYFADNLRRYLQGEGQRNLPCYSGWSSFVLDPYGELKPCVLRSESFGNIKNQPLEEILNSPRARAIRKSLRSCRSCWNICEVSTSAVIDPWDVLGWFIFRASKVKFIKSLFTKQEARWYEDRH